MVLQLPEENFDAFRAYLEDRGFSFEDRPHQVFLARHQDVVVNLYESGKVVLGGSDDLYKREIRWYLTDELGAEDPDAAEDLGIRGTRIGLDEAGKGDYFGPLVVAGVLVDQDQADALLSEGVKDSKALSDTRVGELAGKIRSMLGRDRCRTVTIPPVKYNLLHRDMGSVNRILGWAYARAIEDLLAEADGGVDLVVADRFGDEAYIEDRLLDRGRQVRLQQIPRAEREVSVAAASVLARQAFLDGLEGLSGDHGVDLPKGASEVEQAARDLVRDAGISALIGAAKVHFRTTDRVTDGAGVDRWMERVAAWNDEGRPTGRRLEVRAVVAELTEDLAGLVEERTGGRPDGLAEVGPAVAEAWDAFEPVFGDRMRLVEHLDRLLELSDGEDRGKVLHHVRWIRDHLEPDAPES